MKIGGMEEIKNCPRTSTTLSETPENPSRTVVGEGKVHLETGPEVSSPQACPKPGLSQPRKLVSLFPAQILFAPPSGSACSHSPARFAVGPQRGSAHPSLSMQPFFTACGNPLPPALLALQIKPRSNFGLGSLLPSPPVLSCLTSYGYGAGPGAARACEASSVGTRGRAHRRAACPLAEAPS